MGEGKPGRYVHAGWLGLSLTKGPSETLCPVSLRSVPQSREEGGGVYPHLWWVASRLLTPWHFEPALHKGWHPLGSETSHRLWLRKQLACPSGGDL